MTKLTYSDVSKINIVRKAPRFGAALLMSATFLLFGGAAEQAHAKRFGRGVAIGLGAFGLGVIMNEAARAERYRRYDHDDYRKRSYRKRHKSRSTPRRSSPPKVQFSQQVLETQKSLNQAGYDAGTEDGLRGPQTAAAVKAFQLDQGYQATGRLTATQRKNLYVVAADAANPSDEGNAAAVDTAGEGPLMEAGLKQGSYKPNFDNETTNTIGGGSATEVDTAGKGSLTATTLEPESYKPNFHNETADPIDGGGAAAVDTADDVSLTATSLDRESYKPNFDRQTAQNEVKAVASHENMRQTLPDAEIDPSTLEVEKALFSLQMIQSVPDGKIDDETIMAIKEYQRFRKEAPTGELTPDQRANLMLLVQAYFSFEKK